MVVVSQASLILFHSTFQYRHTDRVIERQVSDVPQNCDSYLRSSGWLVAEWLKHSTANRKVAGSNLTIAIGDFLSPRS